MSILRIVIWNLADSKTTVAEVRERVMPDPDLRFIWNEAQERFGVLAVDDDPGRLEELRALIGKEPEVAEEYDTD